MRPPSLRVIGILTLMAVSGALLIGTPPALARSAGQFKAFEWGPKKPKRDKVTNADLEVLILMLKDQVAMLKDQIDNLPGNEPCPVPPTWGGVIPGDQRFVPTFVEGDTVHAYCDRQTGLVWDAAPEFFEADADQLTWREARFYCARTRTAPWLGQKGGRLPSMAELASLVDQSSTLCAGGGPCLPDGHPFGDHVKNFEVYWTASTDADNSSTGAWFVFFDNGDVATTVKDSNNQAWCVRGATDADVY